MLFRWSFCMISIKCGVTQHTPWSNAGWNTIIVVVYLSCLYLMLSPFWDSLFNGVMLCPKRSRRGNPLFGRSIFWVWRWKVTKMCENRSFDSRNGHILAWSCNRVSDDKWIDHFFWRIMWNRICGPHYLSKASSPYFYPRKRLKIFS